MAELIAKWSDFYITDKGLAMRQRAIAERQQIKFTRAEIGEGIPAVESDVWTMTALLTPVHEAGVTKSYLIDITHHLTIRIDNKGFKAGVMMREIGVFAQLMDKEDTPIGPETLYGYSYAIHGYDPIPPGQNQYRIWEIGANTGISRTSDIHILYGDSVIFVTRDEFEDRFLPLEPYYDLVRIDHGLGCYPSVLLGGLQHGVGMGGLGDGPCGGTDTEQFPAKAVYHDQQSLTVRTIKPITDLGKPVLHQGGPYEYTVTFEGNELDSVKIGLIVNAYSDPMPPGYLESNPFVSNTGRLI